MIKGCIFDLDGTLADTVASIAQAGNYALEQFGLVKRPVEEYNYYAGDGMDKTVERAFHAAGDKEKAHIREGAIRAREYFSRNPLYEVKPFPGIMDLIEVLQRKGILLAVLSNKPHLQAVEVVNTVFGEGVFHVIQGQDSEVLPKPDPSGAMHILGVWGLKPKECLYIGDTDTDMKTGAAAGIPTVGVTWGFRPRKELEQWGADCIIQNPAELVTCLSCNPDTKGGYHD